MVRLHAGRSSAERAFPFQGRSHSEHRTDAGSLSENEFQSAPRLPDFMATEVRIWEKCDSLAC
jgi:hypothetical protein